jgi:hypothetical protein
MRALTFNGLRQTNDEKKSKMPSNHEISVKGDGRLSQASLGRMRRRLRLGFQPGAIGGVSLIGKDASETIP